MLSKRAALLFLSIAYAILLGHNIIPHHHHTNPEELADHHSAHHDHDSGHGGFGHLLSHLFHSADGFTFSTNHNIRNGLSKHHISLIAVLSDNFFFDEITFKPLLLKPPAEKLLFISPHFQIYGLRAPPAAFI